MCFGAEVASGISELRDMARALGRWREISTRSDSSLTLRGSVVGFDPSHGFFLSEVVVGVEKPLLNLLERFADALTQESRLSPLASRVSALQATTP